MSFAGLASVVGSTASSGPILGRRGMKIQLGTLLLTSAVLIGPAAAQDAAGLLQAADKAMGASAVKSVVYTGTGRMGYVGQQFATGDLPRTDLKTYTMSIDYDSKSSKEEFVRVQ